MSFLSNAFSKKSTIVITGGGTGIGFELSTKFVELGHQVIIAGRRQQVLDIAKTKVPQLITIQADLSTEEGRITFHSKVCTEYPQVNVLINNAAVGLRSPPLVEFGIDDWTKQKLTLGVNIEAPIHLVCLFLPQLATKDNALIANVTSVLAFFPFTTAPVYSAAKSALHSFTISLRHQLKDTAVKVVEIIPPSVATDMNTMPGALSVDVYVGDLVEQLLLGGKDEIGYQDDAVIRASRDVLDMLTNKFDGVHVN